MKVQLIINSDIKEDDVTIVAKNHTEQIDSIIALCNEDNNKMTGYGNNSFTVLNLSDIYYFAIESGKTYAFLKDSNWLIKKRIYELEDFLKADRNFIKISQSSIINQHYILKFDLSFNGTILCLFKNGNKEFVSRRYMSSLKAKLGLKEKTKND